MNRLKKIFAAIRDLYSEPSPGKAILAAWEMVKEQIETTAASSIPRDLNMIEKVITAVAAIAEDADKADAKKGGAP